MRNSLICLLLALVLTVSGLPLNRKNVLLVSVDDMRPELSCVDTPGFDHPRMHTPNICELASNSLVLQRSQVAMSTCAPSRTAMVTGRHSGTTRSWDLYSYWRNVSGDFTTIPQLFKDRGYYSVGMGKLFHPGYASGAQPPSQGSPGSFKCARCEGSDDPASWSAPYFHGVDPFDTDFSNSSYAVPKHLTDEQPLCDTQVMEHARATLANISEGRLAQGKPFFLSVGFRKFRLQSVQLTTCVHSVGAH